MLNSLIIEEMKQIEMTEEEYKELFCKEKRIRKRMVLYVSVETHTKFKRLAYTFRKEFATVTSMVDAILWHHLQTNKDLLNRLVREDEEERYRSFKAWVNNESDSTE